MPQNIRNDTYLGKNINYSAYYVAFLDVLGFKTLALSKRNSDKKRIEKYFGLVENVTEELQQMKGKKNLGSIIISDTVILSVPAEGSDRKRIDRLRNLCVAIAKIQFILAQNNIWLRGAISSGLAYFDRFNKNVVGEAYINAHLLEQRHAIYPRVIVDNKIIEELKMESAQNLIDEINFKDNPNNRFLNWTTDILFDWNAKNKFSSSFKQDTALFIDYLSPFTVSSNKVSNIIKHIEKNIYSNNNIYSKFRWIVDYLISLYKFLEHNHDNQMSYSNILSILNALEKY